LLNRKTGEASDPQGKSSAPVLGQSGLGVHHPEAFEAFSDSG
jgi:hypothetical protein